VLAACDDVVPRSSQDREIPRLTFWPRKGTTEWVEYGFKEPRKLSEAAVYWFDDTAVGGGCGLPASWRLLMKVGEEWKPVPLGSADTAVRDEWQRLRFEPIEVDGLRLEVKLRDGLSAGILEWEVN
jgi:hypothetical protein